MSGTRKVIDLSKAPGPGVAWGKSKSTVYLWGAAELMFVTNPWQPSSRLRTAVLRAFGAKIGSGVIFRPRTRVKFPWKLSVGDRSWIGEGVWIHNQDQVAIGNDVVISQEAFLTTGSHAHRDDMALITRPILVGDGCWITSRSLILGGARLGQNCLVNPLTVVKGGVYPENSILSGNPGSVVGHRFGPGVSE